MLLTNRDIAVLKRELKRGPELSRAERVQYLKKLLRDLRQKPRADIEAAEYVESERDSAQNFTKNQALTEARGKMDVHYSSETPRSVTQERSA